MNTDELPSLKEELDRKLFAFIDNEETCRLTGGTSDEIAAIKYSALWHVLSGLADKDVLDAMTRHIAVLSKKTASVMQHVYISTKHPGYIHIVSYSLSKPDITISTYIYKKITAEKVVHCDVSERKEKLADIDRRMNSASFFKIGA